MKKQQLTSPKNRESMINKPQLKNGSPGMLTAGGPSEVSPGMAPSNSQILNGLQSINADGLDKDVQELLQQRKHRELNRSAEYIYDNMVRNFEYSRFIEVDPVKGPITELEKAIDLAEENSIIRLTEGVYTCPKPITVPGLTIEQRDKDTKVIIIGNTGPVINVKLEKGQLVNFKRIIFAHSGIKLTEKFKEAQQDVKYRQKACVKALAEFDIARDMDSILCVNSGGVIMRECVLTLKSIPNRLNQKFTALISFPSSSINLIGCDFIGNETDHTTGAITINSNVQISNCRFSNFKQGAAHIISKRDNRVVIQNSNFFSCSLVGLYLQGVNAEPQILRCNISQIEGPGIKVQRGNKGRIQLCEINDCWIGVQAVSSDPNIMMNKIRKNKENGIQIITKNNLRSDAVIRYNWIEKNLEEGISVEGEENFTRIEKNHHISQNRKAGVKASDGAQVKILNNQIFGNYGQGILIVDTASGYIEKNDVYQNYKANIAFGGLNSADTVILNNLIYQSRSEGIFCIEAGFAWIKHNDIYDNSDGIVMFDSCNHISNNQIHENQRCGIICSGSSFPQIEQNQIYGNNQVGITVRDNSKILIKDNRLFANFYQLSMKSSNEKEQEEINHDNAIEGISEWHNATCNIF